MALIDDLEAKQTRKREVSARFTKASLEALTAAEGPEEFDAAWKRVVENWETVLDRSQKVSDLRQAIRDLAVSGRLLAEAPTTGDASTRADGPFVIPARWRWAPLGDLAEGTAYGTSQKAHEECDGVPVLRMNNIQDARLDLSSLKYVPINTEKLDELMLAQGDLLFNRTNSRELVGKMAVFREPLPYTFASYLIRVRPKAALVLSEYVNLYFASGVCRRTQIEPHITEQTNQANFNGTKLKEITVPTPPLAEQKRIVAKFEQLMKLCDDLEAKLRRAEDRASKLVEAVVQEMVA
jgi:type I restriction enzyme S subunit